MSDRYIFQSALHQAGVKSAWEWAETSTTIRWFTDGKRRYGKELWKLASRYLKQSEITPDYPYRKLGSLPWTGNPSGTTPQVWREGLEVAMKVKGSQGKPHIEWLKQ
jgi:hypothetical protein